MKNKYLILCDGQYIPDDYDDYVCLDHSCIEGIAWCESHHKRYTILDNAIVSDDQLAKVKGEVETYSQWLLQKLTETLNEYHQGNYSERDWRIKLGCWRGIFVTIYYIKYIQLSTVGRACLSNNEIYDCSIINADYRPIYIDSDQYSRTASSLAEYHMYAFSMLIQYMCVNMGADSFLNIINEVPYKKTVTNIATEKFTMGKVYWRLRRIWQGIYGDFMHTDDKVVLHDFAYFPRDFVKEITKENKQIVSYINDYYRQDRRHVPTWVDKEWRKKKSADIAVSSERECRFDKFLLAQAYWELPHTVVEGFLYLKKQAQHVFRHAQHPTAILTAADGLCLDELFQQYLMDLDKRGVTVCDMQHGGNYGISQQIGMDDEYNVSDIFYTWGWSSSKKCKCLFKPMPCLKILTMKYNRNDRGDIFLYVGYNHQSRPIYPYKESIFSYENYLAECNMFKNITERIRKKIIYRPYNCSTNQEGVYPLLEQLHILDSEIQVDRVQNYYESIQQAQLLIFPVWSTANVEALALGYPIIMRLGIAESLLEPEAKEDVQLMRNVGILVDTYAELGQRLLEIHDHVMDWWHDPNRKKVVQHIVDKYAYNPSNAKVMWKEEII